MVRKVISIVAGAALIVAPLPALAEGAQAVSPRMASEGSGPLAAAGPAGVKAAQAYTDIPWVFVVGLSLVGVAVGLALATHSNNSGSTTSTTGT